MSRIFRDIDLSLRHDIRSDVRRKVGVDAINQHLKLLLLTEQDDIPFMNNVSADIRNLMFMGFTPHVRNTLSLLVKNIVGQYEKRITVRDVATKMTDPGALEVTVTYSVRDDSAVGQFKTVLRRTR